MENTKELLDAIKSEVTELVAKNNEGLATSDEVNTLAEKLESFSTTEEVSELKNELSEIAVAVKSMQEKATEEVKESGLMKHINSEERKSHIESGASGMKRTTIKAPATMTVATNVGGANGFQAVVNNFIDPEIGGAPKVEQVILDLVDVRTAEGTEKLWWTERENEEGDAEFIGEGDLKPLIDGEYNTKSADIKEVAERWKQSRRLILHAPSVVADFREHADELVNVKIDQQVLVGDGTGNNLEGITTAASAFVAPSQLANSYQNPNIFDVICAVATSVNLANFMGELTCVLNPVWKAKMKQIKEATTDAYIIPPFVTPDGTEVAGVRVVFSNHMPDTHILLGELNRFKVVFSENIMFDEGYENDDFSKNLVSKKLEAFLGTYLKGTDAGSIIYDAIATIQTAIALP